MPAQNVQQVIDAYESVRSTFNFATYSATLTMAQAHTTGNFEADKAGLLRGIRASVQSAALPEIDGDDTLGFMVNAPEWYS